MRVEFYMSSISLIDFNVLYFVVLFCRLRRRRQHIENTEKPLVKAMVLILWIKIRRDLYVACIYQYQSFIMCKNK